MIKVLVFDASGKSVACVKTLEQNMQAGLDRATIDGREEIKITSVTIGDGK